jgi:hypothetical protein
MGVFPNPATDVMYVQLPAQMGPVVLELHDAAGKLVRTMQIEPAIGGISTSIDISGLARGAYYLTAGGKTVSFIKQ